ncbi:MAG: nuclease family protein [Bacteroidetes bacterium]|nr:nuclease family protein [Bacteroidota bacterium]
MKRGGCVYIMANPANTATYIGVTSELYARVGKHKAKEYKDSHTAKYNITKLVYYIGFHHIEDAIAEEKRIKGMSRKKKYLLVSSMNPGWRDLTEDVADW